MLQTYRPSVILPPRIDPILYRDTVKTYSGFVTAFNIVWIYPQLTLELDCSNDEFYIRDFQTIKRFLYWFLPGDRRELDVMTLPIGSEVTIDVFDYRITGFR